jgi:hypothetical protein
MHARALHAFYNERCMRELPFHSRLLGCIIQCLIYQSALLHKYNVRSWRSDGDRQNGHTTTAVVSSSSSCPPLVMVIVGGAPSGAAAVWSNGLTCIGSASIAGIRAHGSRGKCTVAMALEQQRWLGSVSHRSDARAVCEAYRHALRA